MRQGKPVQALTLPSTSRAPQSEEADALYNQLIAVDQSNIVLETSKAEYLNALIPPPVSMKEYENNPDHCSCAVGKGREKWLRRSHALGWVRVSARSQPPAALVCGWDCVHARAEEDDAGGARQETSDQQ